MNYRRKRDNLKLEIKHIWHKLKQIKHLPHTVRFIIRNPKFCVQNIRKLPEVIKNMNIYREAHPNCAWCGISGIDVHHIKPVHLFPELAADPINYISLNRKPTCHFEKGHLKDWKKYNPDIVAECEAAKKDRTIKSK
jgi:hypothetical protein